MNKRNNWNQTQLDIPDIGEAIEIQKFKRKTELKEKSKRFFAKEQTSLENLIKLTYDITDKDFEYLYAEILKLQWYQKVEVIGWMDDEWRDIRAYKDKKWYFIQCKQWASLYINVSRVGEYYGKIYSKKKKNPQHIFRYVTTSYIDGNAREFLKDHKIDYIDNISLIKLCENYGIFEKGKWQEIRMNIYKMRLEKIKDELNPKEALKNELKIEITHHLPENIRNNNFSYNSIKTRSYIGEFFQLIDSI